MKGGGRSIYWQTQRDYKNREDRRGERTVLCKKTLRKERGSKKKEIKAGEDKRRVTEKERRKGR